MGRSDSCSAADRELDSWCCGLTRGAVDSKLLPGGVTFRYNVDAGAVLCCTCACKSDSKQRKAPFFKNVVCAPQIVDLTPVTSVSRSLLLPVRPTHLS